MAAATSKIDGRAREAEEEREDCNGCWLHQRWMDGWMAGGMDGSRVMDEEGAKKRAKEQGAKE